MPLQSIPNGPYLKGIVASNQPYAQPKGSISRGSNLIYTERGGLTPCDGSQLIHAFNGAIQSGRGKVLTAFYFQPIGVPSYYMALIRSLDLPLGAPQNLTLATAGGGTLPAATYFYKVTALDGVGGETTPSVEASVVTGANGQNTLTWNVVPNASSYNVYRGTASNAEGLLVGTGLPVPQVAPGNLTVTFIDTGAATSPSVAATASWYSIVLPAGVFPTITIPSTAGFYVGQTIVLSGFTGAASFLNGHFSVNVVVNSTQLFLGRLVGNHGTGTGSGTLTVGAPTLSDTTQQVALFQMPVILGSPAQLPVSYNNSNIVALFPANFLQGTGSPVIGGGGGGGTGGGGGGSGGGGGTGGGGTGGRGPFTP